MLMYFIKVIYYFLCTQIKENFQNKLYNNSDINSLKQSLNTLSNEIKNAKECFNLYNKSKRNIQEEKTISEHKKIKNECY